MNTELLMVVSAVLGAIAASVRAFASIAVIWMQIQKDRCCKPQHDAGSGSKFSQSKDDELKTTNAASQIGDVTTTSAKKAEGQLS